ncbi:MAG: hypothetical protein JOZ98_07710 [Solirubrobacterales bacterium]|nr:hypothetical protein [Solirubrobacterales bacterium]MBV9799933.1 hypothetical protein [Solirubrobacterales bacterium]
MLVARAVEAGVLVARAVEAGVLVARAVEAAVLAARAVEAGVLVSREEVCPPPPQPAITKLSPTAAKHARSTPILTPSTRAPSTCVI